MNTSDSKPDSVAFDPQNPDPWLDALVQRTSTMPEAGRRASVQVLRAILNDNHLARSASDFPAAAAPGEWLPWHVQRGRVDVAELGAPGVLVVHEAIAGAAEEEAFVVAALKARAWKETGYDPERLFSRTAN